MEKPQARWPQVIIIGAGFGGLETAKHLGGKPVRVTVIDRTNYHLFQPLLYQVATAAISSLSTTPSRSCTLRRAWRAMSASVVTRITVLPC